MSRFSGQDHSPHLLWEMLRRRAALMMIITAVVFVMGVVLAGRAPVVYQAAADVTFAPRTDAPASADLVRLLVGSKYAVYASSTVAVDQVAADLEMSAAVLDRAIDIVVPTNSGTVEIVVELASAEGAADAANALAAELVALSDLDPLVIGSVISDATPPSSPSGPSTTVLAVASLLLGAALGVAAALLVEQADPRMRTSRELGRETGLPILGSLVESGVASRRPAEVLIDPILGRQLRMLRANLGTPIRTRVAGRHGGPPVDPGLSDEPTESAIGATMTRRRTTRHGTSRRQESAGSSNGNGPTTREHRSARIIGVASPNGGDGRTTLVVLLGAALARGGAKVLLIDGNVRRPALGARLDIPATDGLVDSLRHDGVLTPIEYAGLPGLFVVPTGSDLSAGDVLAELLPDALEQLRGSFDVILVDTPALLASDEARTISSQTDEVVLIVPALTSRQDAGEARDVLDMVAADVVGAVLNRAATAEAGGNGT